MRITNVLILTALLIAGCGLEGSKSHSEPGSWDDSSWGATPDSGDPTLDSSTTMIQEPGVDEGDKIKHDGEYIYIVREKSLRIVKAKPADAMTEVCNVPLPGRAFNLYLWGEKAVVLTQTVLYEYTGFDVPDPDAPPRDDLRVHMARVGVNLIDISEPPEAEAGKALFMDGFLKASRRIGDRLHLVIRRTLPPGMTGTEDDFLKTYRSLDGKGESVMELGGVVQPVKLEEESVLLVASVGLRHLHEGVQVVEFKGKADVVYVSREACYIARGLGERRDRDPDTTHICRVGLRPEGPVLEGMGTVPGLLLDAYSMGEHEGYLRVATETGTWREPSPQVSILRATDGTLNAVGVLTGIAPRDQLDAARFVGERGYLTTSIRWWDPLFTLDLSDPTNPKVAGFVELPGISTHILPISENSLLAVGQTNRWGGVKVSLFDVSDFTQPKVVEEVTLGRGGSSWWGSQSVAGHEPKAFQWYPARNLLALPVDSFGNSNYPNWTRWEDLEVLRVTEGKGFTRLGRLELCVETLEYGYRSPTTWTRSLFLDDTVYGVKHDRVKAANVGESLSDVVGAVTLR